MTNAEGQPQAIPPVTPSGPIPASSARTPSAAPGNNRSWLRRWRRITQPTPPDFPGAMGTEPDQRVSLLNRNPIRLGFEVTIGVLAAIGVVNLVVGVHSVLILICLAFAIALGLNPTVSWLHNHGLRRGLAVLIVAFGLLILLALAGWALFPLVSDQVSTLMTQAPTLLQNLRQNPQIAALDSQFGLISKAITFLTSGDLISGLFGGLVGAGQALANTVFSVTITVVLTLYFLVALPSIKDVIYQLAPASRRPRVRYLANEMFKRVGGYVSGLFTVVAIAMAVAFIFLNIIGLSEYALALAVVVGLFAFVPLVGPTISTIIISIVAFASNSTTSLIALVFFLAYQQFDAYFIQPRVFAKSVQIPGILVMLAAISGGLLLGIVGAILAVPTMAAVLLLYREVLVPHLDRT